jgi:hypothetical protein
MRFFDLLTIVTALLRQRERRSPIAPSNGSSSWMTPASRISGSSWLKPEDARDLAPVYDWFTEGFDTADLKDAKALLDELPRAGNASALGLDSTARDQQAGCRHRVEM